MYNNVLVTHYLDFDIKYFICPFIFKRYFADQLLADKECYIEQFCQVSHLFITFQNNNHCFLKTHRDRLTENKSLWNHTYINFYTFFDSGNNIQECPQSAYKHPV